jgi:TRAP-type C4-dicarboxylate transport system substrate-binding protein
MAHSLNPTLHFTRAALLFGCVLTCVGGPAWSQTPALAEQKLRVVGGLGGVNQYTRHEAPFWTTELPRLSGGRFQADIVPFDRAGIRGQEMLSMIKLGTVQLGTVLLSLGAARDVELGAPDLAGLNPDMATLRRTVSAFRPHLERTLRERHGVELLALYTYPAQTLFCNTALTSLESIKGRRVRTANVSQTDFVSALGATAIALPFTEVLPSLRSGAIDCALTGTMSGYTIGLNELTTHLHTLAVSWGLSVFVANGASWKAMPAELRGLLQRELPKVEAAIWEEAQRETEEGVACNSGAETCKSGKTGRMQVVRASPGDELRRREILTGTVLPNWIKRCGEGCAEMWNRVLAPATGIQAKPF